jgi:glutathione synthase/RimK-type ligase-like ATP-grasp enzyme
VVSTRRPRIAIATCASYPELKGDDEGLAGALRERGCEAELAVWDEDGIDWSTFDLCLVRSTWDYHEKYDEFLAWTRHVAQATTLHNPADPIAWNSKKTYLRELADAGVPTVPTVWVEHNSETDVPGDIAAQGWEDVVVKPVVDLGAKNLHKAGAREAHAALTSVLTRQDAMIQPFLPSLETEGELSLIYIEGTFSHAARKHPAKGDFRVQSIWGGTAEPSTPEPHHLDIAERALAHLAEPPLYARVDLVAGRDGSPCLIELELIEPNLYLSTDPAATNALVNAVLSNCRRRGGYPL